MSDENQALAPPSLSHLIAGMTTLHLQVECLSAIVSGLLVLPTKTQAQAQAVKSALEATVANYAPMKGIGDWSELAETNRALMGQMSQAYLKLVEPMLAAKPPRVRSRAPRRKRRA